MEQDTLNLSTKQLLYFIVYHQGVENIGASVKSTVFDFKIQGEIDFPGGNMNSLDLYLGPWLSNSKAPVFIRWWIISWIGCILYNYW